MAGCCKTSKGYGVDSMMHCGWASPLQPLAQPGGSSSGACSRMTASVSCSPRLDSFSIYSTGIAEKFVG